MKTIDLTIAQELQEVCKAKGITMPKSRFNWQHDWVHRDKFIITDSEIIWDDYRYLAPAFLLCELLEWLPEYIYEDLTYEFLKFEKKENGYEAYYEYHTQFNCYFDPNPANACGKLLIWLIKGGLIN